MHLRLSLSFALLAVAGAALAGLDQIRNKNGLSPISPSMYSAIQIFPGDPNFNSTVIEDFQTLGTVTRASAAFTVAGGLTFQNLRDRIAAWRISLWASPPDAIGSGTNLAGNALATVLVPGGSTDISYSVLSASEDFYRVDIEGLSLVTPPGLVWIGMAAVCRMSEGQIEILENRTPFDRGGGGAQNAIFVNPGQAVRESFALEKDVAYAVESVPEPASLLALAAGLGALAGRRRARR